MPIGNYFTARPFDDPSARTLEGDIANVIDAGAGLAAKARPFLKNFVQNLSGQQQEMLGSAMNVLPTSVNLLGRYYTGLGAKNLDFKDEYKQDLGGKVKEAHRMSAFDQFKLREAEKDAMKRQFLSTLLSTAATTAMTGFSNFAQGRMQDAKAAKAVETASGGKLTKSGNFISGYNIEGSDADVAAFRAQSTFTPTQAKALGLDTSAGAVKIPKAMTRVLNKTIDNRMAEIMGGKDVMRDFYKGTSASQSRVDFLTQQGVDASNMNTVKDKMSFMDFLRSKRKGGGRMAGGYMNKDSMPAYLSEGEYVMNNKAVRKYGLGFMGRLNGGVIPGFQEGGPVGGGANTAPLSSGMGATTNNISINVSVGGGGGGQQASNSGNQNADQTSNKDDATQGKELGEKIRAKVLEVISEEQRLGGSLSKTKRQG